MDKQMIEEMAIKLIMAGDLCRRIKDCDNCKYDYIADSTLCEMHLMAEELLKYYQPKIPEDAVVLTQEEWAEHCEQFAKAMYQKEVNVRKETAEKFAERLKEEAFCVFMGEPIIRASKIDEICKGITEDK